MQESTLALLSLGFGLGLLHALDADHIMAVSALASGNRQTESNKVYRLQTILFCLRWAMGHGGVLLVLGSLVLLAGISIPAGLSMIAEKVVGIFLISLGLWIFWQFYKNRLQLQVHSHNGLTHVHLSEGHLPGDSGSKKSHDHSPMLVGVTHGLAGSAPVLAILPGIQAGHSWYGLLYILMFSLGVVLTMLLFGLFFSQVQRSLENYSKRIFDSFRLCLASISIAFGGYWLFSA